MVLQNSTCFLLLELRGLEQGFGLRAQVCKHPQVAAYEPGPTVSMLSRNIVYCSIAQSTGVQQSMLDGL